MQANELADIEARLCKLELADMQARLRKLESVGWGRCGGADRQEPTAPTGKCFTCGQVGCRASTCPNGNQDAQQRKLKSVGGGRCGRADRQVGAIVVGGGRCGRADRQEPTAPTGKCFTCGQVGCKASTCPNGNQDAQQKHAAKKAERERANPQRQCLLHPELFPKFLGTVHSDLSYELEAQVLVVVCGAQRARNKQLYYCSNSNKRHLAINTTRSCTKPIRDMLGLRDLHGPFLRFCMS